MKPSIQEIDRGHNVTCMTSVDKPLCASWDRDVIIYYLEIVHML